LSCADEVFGIRNVDRMVLDSTPDPNTFGPQLNRDLASTDSAGLAHWAAWAAQRDAQFHLGNTTVPPEEQRQRTKPQVNPATQFSSGTRSHGGPTLHDRGGRSRRDQLVDTHGEPADLPVEVD
jgi:hypothetical protein